jgi:hypothetical protein
MNMAERELEIRNIRAGIRQEPQTLPARDITTGGRTSIVNENVHLTDAQHLHQERTMADPIWVRELFPAELSNYRALVAKYKFGISDFKPRGNNNYISFVASNGRYVVVNLTTDKTKTFDDKSELRFDF